MVVPAILWDGLKKLNGTLYVTELSVDYVLQDFSDTNLEFSLKYDEIAAVEYHKIYDLNLLGIQITAKSGRQNIFVMDAPSEILKTIEKRKR